MAVVSSSLMQGPSKFSDPFLLPSTESFPRDVRSHFDLNLFLAKINPLYLAVTERIVGYFLTDIEFNEGGSSDENDKLEKVLRETLKVFPKMQEAGRRWAIDGQAFVRVVEPFDRWLMDERGGRLQAIALNRIPEHLVKYNPSDMTYTIPDIVAAKKLPKEKRKIDNLPKVTLPFRDKPSPAPERFSIIFLDPRYMELDSPHHADTTEYIYRIPPDMLSRIERGHLHEVNNTPRGLLEAVAKNKDYRFRKGEVHHFQGRKIPGVSDSGWTVPEVLMHYDALYQLQVYRKADFAIAQDLLTPFRVFTPDLGSGQVGDVVLKSILANWRGEMQNMIKKRRQDATAIHALPFPAQMHQYGGDGRNMVLHDVVEAYTDSLFDGLGFPRELFRGTMQVDQLPSAIRMFEKQYEWLYVELDSLLRFISNNVQQAKDSDVVEVKLKRPAMAYSAEWMQLRMQLAANREIPRKDVYPEIGVADPESAALRAAQEDQQIQRDIEEAARSFEKELTQGSMADIAMAAAEQGMMAAQQGGGGAAPAPGGGMGPGGGGLDYSVNPGEDPSQLQMRAQEIASQWLMMHQNQPNSHRKEMQMCEATHPTLYAAAKDAMSKMRGAAESEGRANVGNMLQQ